MSDPKPQFPPRVWVNPYDFNDEPENPSLDCFLQFPKYGPVPLLANFKQYLSIGEHEHILNMEVAKLNALLKEAREALEFYANDAFKNKELDEEIRNGGFFPYGIEDCPINNDRGKIAREALDKLKGLEGG